jgi:septum formation protein
VTQPPILLASASPRRAELLSLLGLSFHVVPSEVPEELLEGESPEEHAERLSREKALRGSVRYPESLVIAGDTVVVLDGKVLGKPVSEDDAVGMLCSLAGRSHEVISGLAIAFPGRGLRSGYLSTEVTFRAFGEEFARRYVDTGEPMDKAGAYGIQGLGSTLVEGIKGDYHTVVGLPLPLLLDLLREEGWRYGFGTLIPGESAEDPG